MCYRFRKDIFSLYLFAVFLINCDGLLILKWESYPCRRNLSTVYDSALLVRGESLHMSCSICSVCEPKLKECKENFSFDKWMLKKSKTIKKKPKVWNKVQLTSLRDRIRMRLYKGSGILPNDTFRLPGVGKRFMSRVEGKVIRNQLNLFFTIEKPNNPPRRFTDTLIKGRSSRVYVKSDKLTIRRTIPDDTGIYTCMYRNRPRIVWVITVLEIGVEPYRKIVWPHVTLNMSWNENDQNDLNSDEDDFPRLLRRKTFSDANFQVYTSWSKWSDCVPCVSDLPLGSDPEKGGEGFQMRVGTCYIKTLDPFYPIRPFRLARQSNAALRQHSNFGLPCRSHVIVAGVKSSDIKGLAKRPSELIMRPCYKPCSRPRSSALFKFKENSRGMDNESSLNAADVISKPKYKFQKTVGGERVTISCPIQGTVRFPITWFKLNTSMSDVRKFVRYALSAEVFALVGNPTGYLASALQQLNLSMLHSQFKGRISLDPGYNLIYHVIDSDVDMREKSKEHILPVFRLACVHGDARQFDFKRSYWAGIISVETIVRWKYLYVVTGITSAFRMFMPALLAICTIIIVLRSLIVERKPLLQAAALGRPLRDPI